MIIGMQMKLDIPAPLSPTHPVPRRPVGFHCIRNVHNMKAGMSTAAAINVLIKMLPCNDPVFKANA